MKTKVWAERVGENSNAMPYVMVDEDNPYRCDMLDDCLFIEFIDDGEIYRVHSDWYELEAFGVGVDSSLDERDLLAVLPSDLVTTVEARINAYRMGLV